jgi:hypothetical protein
VSAASALARTAAVGRPGIGRRAARLLARRELARPMYRESIITRFSHWLSRVLSHLGNAVGSLPGGWWTSVALVAALVLAVAAVVFWIRPAGPRRTTAGALLAGRSLSARQHRDLAEGHAADGDYAAAIVERTRAVAATVEERGLLPAQPGRTADELAARAGQALPELASQLAAAAQLFDDVLYGGREGTQAGYDQVTRLDAAVLAARAGIAAEPARETSAAGAA